MGRAEVGREGKTHMYIYVVGDPGLCDSHASWHGQPSDELSAPSRQGAPHVGGICTALHAIGIPLNPIIGCSASARPHRDGGDAERAHALDAEQLQLSQHGQLLQAGVRGVVQAPALTCAPAHARAHMPTSTLPRMHSERGCGTAPEHAWTCAGTLRQPLTRFMQCTEGAPYKTAPGTYNTSSNALRAHPQPAWPHSQQVQAGKRR